MKFSVTMETPLSEDVRALVAALNTWALTQTPAECCHHLSVEQMADPSVSVFIARDEAGRAIGMGALKRHSDRIGEVKRMFTYPEARGSGVASAIVSRIIALARDQGLPQLSLETGSAKGFASAWRVYERAGFVLGEPFSDYPPGSPHNLYYHLRLQEGAHA